MRVAAIDIGTNSVLLTMAEFFPSGKLNPLYEAQRITRLGRGTAETKSLSRENMKKTLAVVSEFQNQAVKLGAGPIWTVGTSALREAKNSGEFIRRLQARTGLELEIISGRKEAELGLRGALIDLKLSRPKIILLDIGGGSTEVTLARRRRIVKSTSLNLGAVRLTEQFFPGNIITSARLHNLLNYLSDGWIRPKGWSLMNSQLVGIGGTITTLAALDLSLKRYDSKKVHGHILSVYKVKDFLLQLSSLTLAGRKRFLHLDPARADIIVAGVAILFSFMENFYFSRIRVSDKGVRWGLLYSKLELN
jgi:exopolyphosphatase/guanosine-5'-triphosphate,3'-diphosphate pyrophosphatase